MSNSLDVLLGLHVHFHNSLHEKCLSLSLPGYNGTFCTHKSQLHFTAPCLIAGVNLDKKIFVRLFLTLPVNLFIFYLGAIICGGREAGGLSVQVFIRQEKLIVYGSCFHCWASASL